MDVDKLIRHPEGRNYACCIVGLGFTGIKLEAYTRQGLKSIHEMVLSKLTSKQPCTQRCSEVYEDVSRWCDTCNAWQKQLCKVSNRKNIKFDKMMSWNWPTSYESIAPFFLPQSWKNQDFQDISTSCHIWDLSKNIFKIRRHVLNNLRECRNNFVAHNPRSRVTDIGKAKVFDALKDAFKDADVKLHIVAQDCLSELDRIEKGDMLSNSLISIFEDLRKQCDKIEHIENLLERLMESQNDLHSAIEKFDEKQDRIQASVLNIKRKQNEMERNLRVIHKRVIMTKENNIGKQVRNFFMTPRLQIISIAILAIFLSICFNDYGYKDTIKVNHMLSTKDCLSEEYTYPFKQDLPLLEYIYDSEPIIGREWLYEIMESKLISSNSTFKGVAMIADMGYGKSSFVSHILCAKEREKGYAIKSHVVAFHICKFDVKSTQSPARFIRRLIGFLATRFEEYGNITSTMAHHNIIYSQEFCENDPIACFDQSIIFPFRQLSFDSNFPWILIIEALDECFEKSSGKNLILELLLARVRELPKWFKVFVTSRSIETVAYLLDKFEHVDLKPKDSRNIRDIKEYIQVKYSSHGLENNGSEIEKIIKLCDGNFLFLIHAIRFRLENGNITSLPDSLEEIYELNFDRQYDDTDSFLPSKAVLEIVLASFKLLSEEDIFHILVSNNITDKVQFRAHMKKLSFFLRNDNFVTIFHQSLYQWLKNSENKKYSLSLKAGHAFISCFLFNEISNKREVDIADLSIHVSEALNDTLNQKFLALDIDNLNNNNVNEALHNVIRKTEGINALSLLIKHNLDVNTLHEGQSPSFIAALKGNIDQLLCLLNNGANVSFVTESNYAVYSSVVYLAIQEIKQSRYYGYGLIHIAAKHGHEKIVSKLLEYNKDMIYWKTSLGQRSSDIACEMGNFKVLQTFSNLDNDMLSDCIYYAARSGNENIIQSLIERKLYLSCISDEQSRDAYKEMEVKNPKNVKIKDDFTLKLDPPGQIIYPLDKWWIVKKETPIHAAIRSGSTKVAKLLIKIFPGLLDCTDSFGYTPTLLSVVKNQFDLLPLLTDHISTDRCDPYYCDTFHCRDDLLTCLYHFYFDFRSTNYTSSFVDVERYCCENGSSFMDLSIKYKRHKFTIYAIEENIITDLISTDEEGIHLIHFAARDANTYFIDYAIKDLKLDISSIKCKNGSTAYHIAAKTASIPSLFRLTNGFTVVIPDIKDINERGFLHYTCLFDQNSQFYIRSRFDDVKNPQNRSLECFQYFVEVCNINIQSTDVFGRNILHYALLNGHFSIIEYITINYPLEFRKLLNQKDVNSQTPVQYALAKVYTIKMLQHSFIEFVVLSRSHVLDQFKSCFSKERPCTHFKMAWEISFMFTIRELNLEEFQTVIEPFLYLFLIKGGNVFNFIWAFHTQITDEVLGAHIIKSIDENKQPSDATLWNIAHYRPTVFNKCGLPFKRSPLHYIALNGRFVPIGNVLGQLWINKTWYNSSFNVLNCADENGNLVFHYALMKGDTILALSLLDEMRNISKEMIVDVFLFTILCDKQSYEECWKTGNIYKFDQEKHETFKTDLILSDAIRKYKDVLQITDFCKNNSKMLSVVHLLSVSFMKKHFQNIS